MAKLILSIFPLAHTAAVVAVVTGLTLGEIGPALAQDQPVYVPESSLPKPATQPHHRRASSLPAPAKTMPKPEWHELSPAQQAALSPLQASWSEIDEVRKRKWLVMSQNFAKLTPPEQERMHARMKEWATLSPQERTLARLNFAGARDLPANQRLEKWEAYQSLPSEQRRHLAATAPAKPTGGATAVKPIAPQRLAITPAAAPPLAKGNPPAPHRLPKISTDASLVDRHTLLPVPATEAAKQP